MNDSPASDVIHRRLLAQVGSAMIAGGAPVNDAEDEVRRLAARLGHGQAQVAGYPTWISLSLAPGEPAAIQRIEGGLRLDQSVAITEVRRDLMGGEADLARALGAIARIRRQPPRYGLWGLGIGNTMAAMGICLIMQPGWRNVAVVGVASLVVLALMVGSARHRLLSALLPTAAALAASLIVLLAARHGLLHGPLRTLICPIAVLLPGGLLSAGVTELASGSVVSGTARVSQGLTQLLLFALGVVSATTLLGIDVATLTNTRVNEIGWWAAPLGLVAVGVGITLAEAIPWRLAGWSFGVMVATYLTQAWGQSLGTPLPVGAFLGAIVAACISICLEAARPTVPQFVTFLPSFWLLVPGTLGLMGITTIGVGTGRADALYQVVVLVAAIALGLLVGSTLALPVRRALRRR